MQPTQSSNDLLTDEQRGQQQPNQLKELQKDPSRSPNNTERVSHLWKKARNLASSIGRFNKISNDIQLFGAPKNAYTMKEGVSGTVAFADQVAGCCVLTPRSKFKKAWTFILSVLLLYTAIFTPYLIAFSDEAEDTVWLSIGYVVDGLFAVDIFVNFLSTYYDHEGELVTNNWKIAKHYLGGWFAFDLVACLPMQLLLDGVSDSSQDYNKLIRLLRLPRLYRLIRVIKLFRLFKKHSSWVTRLTARFKLNSGVLRLVKFNLTVLIILHIVGCLWYFTAKLDDFAQDTWVFRYEYLDASTTTLYITSIYWVCTTLTTVGYGDLVPYTPVEQVFTLILMIFGVGFYSYAISNLSSIMSDFDSQQSRLKAKLQALKQLSKMANLPVELTRRIKHHINLNDKNSKYFMNEQESLMNELPSAVRTELSLHIYRNIVKKVYFMQDKDPGFISYIVPKLRMIQLKPQEILFKEFEHPEEVYFIIKGRVNLLTSNGVIFKSYNQGSYFGEDELLDNRLRDHTVQAAESGAKLLVLSRSHFLKMLDEFPMIAEEFYETARIRASRNRKSKSAALNLCRGSVVQRSVRASHPTVTRLQTRLQTRQTQGFAKKRRGIHSIREKNRKMWETAANSGQPPKESKWDMIINTILKKKKPPVGKTEGTQPASVATGIVQHLVQPSVEPKEDSKWAVLRGSRQRLLELSNNLKESKRTAGSGQAAHPFNINSFADEAPVHSPLNRSVDSDNLLLLRFLKSYLSQHNMKLTYNLNIVRSSLTTLKQRHERIESDIAKLRAYQDREFASKN